MAYTVPVVSYAAANDFEGTYTALTGIQSVQISRGRRRFQDPFPGAVCSIELIPANSYTLPLEPGQWIDVRVSNSSTARAWFTGRISDVQRDYAFPYNSGTGAAPADRITITALGAVGWLGYGGPVLISGTTFTGDARLAIDAIISRPKIYMDGAIGPGADAINLFGVSTTSTEAKTVSNIELVNNLLNSGQAFIDDIDMKRDAVGTKALAINTYKSSSRAWTFSDNPGAGEYKFTGITYLSGAQETFTEVVVNGWDSSVTPQSASTGSGEPYNTLSYSTQLNSTATMQSLANYLLTVQNETEPTPVIIRSNTMVADGIEQVCYCPRLQGTDFFDQIIGAIVTVEFRGTTVESQVQGVSMAFYADHANFEFYLSPFLGVAFTLDDTLQGVLDTNRLGYP